MGAALSPLLIAIDPGNAKIAGRVCYTAQFIGGELQTVGPMTRESAGKLTHEWRRIGIRPTVAIERPQMDARSRKVPPNVLIGLAWNGALVASALDPVALVEYTPTEWKGSINKAPHHLQIWRRLSEEERNVFVPALAELRKRKQKTDPTDAAGVYALLSKAAEKHARTGESVPHVFDDVLDAVGVGLRYLGRLG